MPELPEVESLLRSIEPKILGRRILRVDSSWPRALLNASPASATRLLRGRRIVGCNRRGKYFVLVAEADRCLVGHLRMSGNLFWARSGSAEPDFLRHRIVFEGGWELQFTDARKFGRLWVGRSPERYLSHLGPEPLGSEWTARRLAADLATRRRMLKPLLLDQKFVAGLGNIYVDEALHRARIHPLRQSDLLSWEEVRRLHQSVRTVLRAAIRQGGTSFDWALSRRDGRPQGYFQVRLRAYGRAGRPCRRCGELLERIVVAQRGTTLCPACQPRAGSRGSKPRKAKKSAATTVSA